MDDQKDLNIQLLKETMWDIRDQRNFFKIMNVILCCIIFCLIIGMTVIGLYNQKMLKDIALYKYQNIENVTNSPADK